MEIVVYSYWRSSSSHRVRLALAMKKIQHRVVTVNLLAGEQSSEELVKLSPMGHIPCLVVDGEPFVESVAIIELLDDLFPSPRLYPSDPKDRARVRAMCEIINSGTQPLQNLRVLARVALDQEGRAAFARAFNEHGLLAFERMMEKKPGRYSFGDTLTAADCFLLPQVLSARRFGADLSRMPRVVAAADAIAALPEAASAAPEVQPGAPG